MPKTSVDDKGHIGIREAVVSIVASPVIIMYIKLGPESLPLS